MSAYDCVHKGHVWAEGTAKCGVNDTLSHQLFVRTSARPRGTVRVYCIHCGTTTELQAHGKATVRPGPAPVAVTTQRVR